MRGATTLWLSEVRLFLREPAAAFFNLAFPVALVLLFAKQGAMDDPRMGSVDRIDVLVPAMVGLVIATSGLMSITMQVAINRERGFFRRLMATPLRPTGILAGVGGSFVAVTVLGIGGVLITGAALGARSPSHPVAFVGAVVLSSAALFGVGILLAAALPSGRVAQAAAPAVFFPMMFLSGMTVPRELQSPTVRAVADWLPLTHAVELLRRSWDGGSAPLLGHVVVLMGVAIVAIGVGLRMFKWGST